MVKEYKVDGVTYVDLTSTEEVIPLDDTDSEEEVTSQLKTVNLGAPTTDGHPNTPHFEIGESSRVRDPPTETVLRAFRAYQAQQTAEGLRVQSKLDVTEDELDDLVQLMHEITHNLKIMDHRQKVHEEENIRHHEDTRLIAELGFCWTVIGILLTIAWMLYHMLF
ncbi:hypothetical protein R6Q59_003073 [Mikania micrantha]